MVGLRRGKREPRPVFWDQIREPKNRRGPDFCTGAQSGGLVWPYTKFENAKMIFMSSSKRIYRKLENLSLAVRNDPQRLKTKY